MGSLLLLALSYLTRMAEAGICYGIEVSPDPNNLVVPND